MIVEGTVPLHRQSFTGIKRKKVRIFFFCFTSTVSTEPALTIMGIPVEVAHAYGIFVSQT